MMMNNNKIEPAPCSRTALVRDRYMDEIKLEMNGGKHLKKVDDKVWNKIVERMKEREKNKRKREC